MMRRTFLARMLIVLVAAMIVASCGKKGAPQPPPGEPNTFPTVYPRE